MPGNEVSGPPRTGRAPGAPGVDGRDGRDGASTGPRHAAPRGRAVRRAGDEQAPRSLVDPTVEADGDDGRSARGGAARVRHRRRRLRRTVLEWIAVVGGGVLIALVVEAFFIQAFWIPSPSMTPTLQVGDRVLVNKLSYRFGDVDRGDIIVFERPANASSGEDGEIKDLIKRVIATGGDSIEARDGQVLVNGEVVEESYLTAGTPTDNLPAQTIPEDHVFVMGDNRLNSEDSRVFGPIAEDRIVGRAFIRVLPLSDIGRL